MSSALFNDLLGFYIAFQNFSTWLWNALSIKLIDLISPQLDSSNSAFDFVINYIVDNAAVFNYSLGEFIFGSALSFVLVYKLIKWFIPT